MILRMQQIDNRLHPYALLALRVVLGIVFMQHGWWKVIHFDLAVELFTKWGLPLPTLSTELAAVTELLGAIALILGVGVLYAAVPLAFTMAVAIYYSAGHMN